MIQTNTQFQEDYKNWNRESEIKDYIQTLIPDNMTISSEALDTITNMVTEYTHLLAKEFVRVQQFERRHDNDAFNVGMILKHNSAELEKKVKKNYFINTTLSNQR